MSNGYEVEPKAGTRWETDFRVTSVCDDEFVDFRLLCCRLVDLSEGVCDHGLNTLGYVVKGDNLPSGPRHQAIQPVEEFHQHFQSSPLASQRQSAQFPRQFQFLFILTSFLNEIIMLESDRVVKEELLNFTELVLDATYGEVPREETWDIGEHEGNVLG